MRALVSRILSSIATGMASSWPPKQAALHYGGTLTDSHNSFGGSFVGTINIGGTIAALILAPLFWGQCAHYYHWGHSAWHYRDTLTGTLFYGALYGH